MRKRKNNLLVQDPYEGKEGFFKSLVSRKL